MTRIVVGIDGSSYSARALRRAMEEAELRSGHVDAVFAFEPPHRSLGDDFIELPYGIGMGIAAAGRVDVDDQDHPMERLLQEAERRAEERMRRFVDESLAGATDERPHLVVVPDAHPAQVLIDQSRTADLLVLGTRGRGGFTGMLLGSVTQQCIQHARCPMLVLPPEA